MDTLLQDIRYAFRRILRSPGFTSIALLSLAVGIGTNTAVFTLVEGFLFPTLAYENPEEIIEVYLGQDVFAYSPLSYPDYLSVREGADEIFAEMGLGGYAFGQVEKEGQVVSLFGELVSGTYFPTLGMGASIGRTILPEDDLSPGSSYVMMLGHGYWEREYGADPGVLGQTLVMNGKAYTIIGVARDDYTGVVRAEGVPLDFIIPITMANAITQSSGDILASRDNQSYFARARLRPGVSLEQANVTLAGIAASLEETYPNQWDGSRRFIPMYTEDVVMNPVFDKVLVPASILALVLVGVVLLIACANLASFLLARGTDRRKEIAMRLALGAQRGTLIRQLLTETTLLAVMGGVLGMGVSIWLLNLLMGMDLPLPGDISIELGMTGRGFLFGLGITAVTGFLFGLAPALQSTNPDVAPTLKDESTGGGKPRRFTLRNALVAGQVAASLFLLISAGLFLRSAQARQSVDPGFAEAPSAFLSFIVSGERYDAESGRVFVQEYLNRLEEQPGIVAAGAIGNIHLNTTSTQTMDLNVDGVEPPPGRRVWEINQSVATPEWFESAGIPIVQGRNFLDTDLPDGVRVCIVNEVFAEKFWPGEDPIGKIVRRESGQELLVVGVARATKVRTLGEGPTEFIYTPYSQRYTSFLTVLVQTRDLPETGLRVAFNTLREMDPEIVVLETKTMETHLGVQLMPARLGALLSTVFALVALVLASIGLYGIVSYAVSRRSREMGIRMSLGAAPGKVVQQVVREGMVLVGVGTLLGLVLALLGSQVLRSLLFGVAALDPITFLGVPMILLAVTLVASYVPARRASRVDPVRALKAE